MRTTSDHFLKVLPFDFARPESQDLLAFLMTNIYLSREILVLLKAAKVSPASINLDQPAKAIWHDVLEKARQQGRLFELLEAICADPERAELAPRIREFLADRPVIEARRDSSGLRANGWQGKQERIIGQISTLVDVAFLAQGARCAKAVTRVTAEFRGGPQYGTGFFVTPDLILTNHHVLFDDNLGRADAVEIWLDYECDAAGLIVQHAVRRGLAETIDGDAPSDWAVVRLEIPAGETVPVLPLAPRQTVKAGDRVAIIQHPLGMPKKIGLVHNEVRFIDDDVVQYLTDTDHGSSGAPVFNEKWEVVALHHMWTEVSSTAGPAEIRNEGIRIERVAKQLQARGYLP